MMPVLMSMVLHYRDMLIPHMLILLLLLANQHIRQMMTSPRLNGTLEFVIQLQDAPGSFIEEVVVATIYDWKRPSTPMGEYDWHIGGFSTQVIECVYSSLQEKVL